MRTNAVTTVSVWKEAKTWYGTGMQYLQRLRNTSWALYYVNLSCNFSLWLQNDTNCSMEWNHIYSLLCFFPLAGTGVIQVGSAQVKRRMMMLTDATVCFSWPSCCILTQRERRHATWSVLVDTSSTSHHVEENAGLHLSTRIVLQLISVVIIFNNAVTHWLIRKAMARIIRHRARREHITSVLSEMHWLAVWCLVHFNVAIFLPRCMECRRGLAMRILSVSLSVRTSNAWYVTKWNKDLSRFLCHTKDRLA